MISAALELEVSCIQKSVPGTDNQLAQYDQQVLNGKRKKPKSTLAFRKLWVRFYREYDGWEADLKIFKPSTVIRWHEAAAKKIWAHKSRKRGRPKISAEVIKLVKRIHKENPLLSPEKIVEKIKLLGIIDPPSPNTIRKYLPTIRKTPTEQQAQNWRSFLRNHTTASVSCGMDFFVVTTLTFQRLYVLVMIEHGSRQIKHTAITKNPNSTWVIQQLRNATPYGECPKYLFHDNDSTFTSKDMQDFLRASSIKSVKTSIKSPWQNPYAERVIGTIRRDLLDHIIPINEKHLKKLLDEYIHKYYNPHRTHQGLDGNTPIPSPDYPKTLVKDTLLISEPILGGLYNIYRKIA